ncbi:MAG: hypothetical protein RL410_1107 [Actinomycetota bacterium]|jgi:hypothetical protein
MSDKPQQTAELMCSVCNRESVHAVHYAGRILAHSKCLSCGTVYRQTPAVLRKSYFRDLEHRVKTKPFRLFRRLRIDPGYLREGFIEGVKRQPSKFIDEAKELRNTDKHPDA